MKSRGGLEREVPLLLPRFYFFALLFTSHRSPLSKRLEQATTKTFVTFVVWEGALRDDTKNGHKEDTVRYMRLFAYLNDLICISKSIGSRKVSPTRTERNIGTPSITWKERNKTTPSGTRKPQKGAAWGHTRQPEVAFFGFLGSGFAQIFGQTDSIRQKKLSSIHFVASRHM